VSARRGLAACVSSIWRLGSAPRLARSTFTTPAVSFSLNWTARAASGYCPRSDNPDPLRFNDEEIDADRFDPRFELLPLQPLIDSCTRDQNGGALLDNDAFVQRLAETLGGDNAAACSNTISVEFLLGHLPLTSADGIDLYFEWPARDRRSARLDRLMASRPDLLG